MDLRLKDRRALITGSSSGIGEAVADALVHEGVRVRVEEVAQAVAAEPRLRVLRDVPVTGSAAARYLDYLRAINGDGETG